MERSMGNVLTRFFSPPALARFSSLFRFSSDAKSELAPKYCPNEPESRRERFSILRKRSKGKPAVH